MMAELKTQKNDASVEDFLNKVEPDWKREDSFRILEIMKDVTGDQPSMWGDSIVGFGSYHYKTKSGREADWFKIGFSPRKQNLTMYVMTGYEGYEDLLDKLGKFKTGVSCLYVKHLHDIDEEILRKMLIRTIEKIASQEVAQ
jgi:hypothetical protein